MNTIDEIIEMQGIAVREFKVYKYDLNVVEVIFPEVFEKVDKTFVDYIHLPEYDKIIKWLSNTKGKGLFMTGSYGRGKSVILTGVIPVLFRALYDKIIIPVSAKELKKDIQWCVCIDDIGQEEIINDWGTKIDAVEYAISHCEDKAKLLIMTSNLNSAQLEERYGGRILDRIKRLCMVVEFKGKSLRK